MLNISIDDSPLLMLALPVKLPRGRTFSC